MEFDGRFSNAIITLIIKKGRITLKDFSLILFMRKNLWFCFILLMFCSILILLLQKFLLNSWSDLFMWVQHKLFPPRWATLLTNKEQRCSASTNAIAIRLRTQLLCNYERRCMTTVMLAYKFSFKGHKLQFHRL